MKRALILIALAACGGGGKATKTTGTVATKAKLDPVNPKAAKEFDGAMRALRVGGPESLDTAKARLKVAVEIDPTLWEAWHDLGAIAYKEGDDDAAIDGFTRALKIRGGHTSSLLARAERLQSYNYMVGDPGFLTEDLRRYRAVDAAAIQRAAQQYLRKDGRVIVTIDPNPEAPIMGRIKK